MHRKITCTEVRLQLDTICDRAIIEGTPIYITRDGGEDVALIAASELRSLLETVHLLKSVKNATRLQSALDRALSRNG